jgi:hypothetical protein
MRLLLLPRLQGIAILNTIIILVTEFNVCGSYSYNNYKSAPNSSKNPRFSFYREFIAPLPGVIDDFVPSISINDPIVQIQNGLVRGLVKRSRDGREYRAFLGIPYAQPPVNHLRFEVCSSSLFLRSVFLF